LTVDAMGKMCYTYSERTVFVLDYLLTRTRERCKIHPKKNDQHLRIIIAK